MISKNIFSVLVLIFTMAFANFAQASIGGNEVGNGEGLVECNSVGPSDLMTLEEYELFVNGQAIVAPQNILNLDSDISLAHAYLQELEVIDPVLADRLNARVDSFYAESAVNYISPLMWLPDQGYTPINSGNPFCTLHQLVVQKSEGDNTFAPVYTLSAEYWNRLLPFNRAIAILHEVIYRSALETNPSLFNSVNVRSFVKMIATNKFDRSQLQGSNLQETHQKIIQFLAFP